MKAGYNTVYTYMLPDNGGPPIYLNPDGTVGMAPMLSPEEFEAQQTAFRKIAFKKGEYVE